MNFVFNSILLIPVFGLLILSAIILAAMIMPNADASLTITPVTIDKPIISSKTPAVLVPLPRGWDDQFHRAEVLEKLGCVKIVKTEIMDPVKDILNNWQSYHESFPCIKSGNIKAAQILSDVLNSKISKG